MSPDDELTILLTLKDRAPFTFRWMSYVDGIRFPFKVLIADGGSDDSVASVLSNHANFQNVNYEYTSYPHDESYAHYYAKVADALSRIRTPFVAIAENDDLFVVGGLRAAVQFLRDHPDYSTCGGQCAVFWVTSPPGQMNQRAGAVYGQHVDWKCSLDPQSLVGDTARARLRDQALIANETYHHVQRTAELRDQFKTVWEWDPKDLFLVELLLSFLTTIAGKTQQLNTLYLAKQLNSPGGAAGAHVEKCGDWLGRMLVQSWSDDFTKFVHIASAALAARDGLAMDEARRSVIESYRMQAAPELLADLLAGPTVTMPMSMVVCVVRRLLTLPSESLIRKIARSLYRRVRWISADAVHGTQLRARRISNARHEFEPIYDFLTRQAAVVVEHP